MAAFFALMGATNDWEPAFQRWREIGVHDFVAAGVDRVSRIEADTAIILALAVFLVSLFIWMIHTKPKRQIKDVYFSELEQKFPGLKERQRGRRSKRRRRGRKR